MTQQSCLTFRFLSSPLLSLSLPHFLSFAGHVVDYILEGNAFGKAFRILGSNKSRLLVEQDFQGNYQVNVTWFFAIFSGVFH